MKKYLLMLSCSMILAGQAQALTAEQQLNAMKGIFLNEFMEMDKNHDGHINQSEYMSYQFDNFRNNVMAATGFETTEELPKDVPALEVSETKKTEEVELGGVSPALKEMAEFKLEEEPEIDLSVSEEDSLQNILADMEQKEAPKEEVPQKSKEEIEAREKQINFMMETIKKSLPKQIDEVTTWTDITYADNTISYIYSANIDAKKLSQKDKSSLLESIKNEACAKAYEDMCPKIKTMFIDEGINMKIRYLDINNEELSFCEFNKITCK